MTVDEAMLELQRWFGFPDDCAIFTFALSILQDLWDTAEEEGRADGLEEGYTKAQEQVGEWNRPAGR